MRRTLVVLVAALTLGGCGGGSLTGTAIQYSLSAAQGFSYQKDVHYPFGVLTSWSFTGPGLTLTPDLVSTDPTTGQSVHVVGILTNFSWAGGTGDPIDLQLRVSTTNEQSLLNVLHNPPSNTTETFSLTIYSWDPTAGKWFVAFQPVSPPLKGLIQKNSSNALLLSVNTTRNTDVSTPTNYSVTSDALPQSGATQSIDYRISSSSSVVKTWG
jgi:hypothetical protein